MWWDVLRVINVITVVAVFVMAYIHRRRWLCRKPPCWRSMVVTLLLTAAIGYGSFEAIRRGLPGGTRVVIYTIALLAPLLHVVFWPGSPEHQNHVKVGDPR